MDVSAQEFVEIQNLYHRYCYSVDRNDPEAVVATFTPDGVFERTNTSAAFPDLMRLEGVDALLDYFRARSSRMAPNQHWINNLWLERRDGAIWGHASFAILHAANGVGEILSLGSYEDEIVQLGGQWRFRNRFIRFLY